MLSVPLPAVLYQIISQSIMMGCRSDCRRATRHAAKIMTHVKFEMDCLHCIAHYCTVCFSGRQPSLEAAAASFYSQPVCNYVQYCISELSLRSESMPVFRGTVLYKYRLYILKLHAAVSAELLSSLRSRHSASASLPTILHFMQRRRTAADTVSRYISFKATKASSSGAHPSAPSHSSLALPSIVVIVLLALNFQSRATSAPVPAASPDVFSFGPKLS